MDLKIEINLYWLKNEFAVSVLCISYVFHMYSAYFIHIVHILCV